ncbi:peptidoglycan-binding domain-containing protein [Streptomyces cyaneofuscatus]|uniref:peptidoglycan-binding domain-containing protein n=1 Tax=Streptomyces cyaneofuscatus TaxID=66883 RepID=UPI002D76EDE1|nr:peptidoglycan-binding domain-containing protein [Streptomyces cyaneofuscatus]WRO09830.1 peptidoglycan-binding domain-containing protein [Streptomyces cyaneofuscatus]
MTGHACPECGRRTAGEPGTEHRVPCRCGTDTGATPLTGDELRAARSAEMAAAEDFDPLRIRPYVTLGDASAGEGGGAGDGGAAGDGAGGSAEAGVVAGDGGSGRGDAATTMPLHLGMGTGSDADSRTGMGTGPGPGAAHPPAVDESRRRTASPGAGAHPGAGPATGTGPDFSTPPAAPDPVQPRRRRPFAALAVGAAVAAVVGTAAFAGGLFDRDGSQEEALPEATTSAPDNADEPAAASVAPSPSPSAAPSRTASASPTPSASSASPSPSASPSESAEPSPTASAPATPTPGAPSASATGDAPPPSAAPPAELAPSSLRRGDQGPQVAVLQNRLAEVWLYHGDADGNFNDRVENAVRVYQSYKAIQGDPAGVYGPETRRALEAETTGRGRD